MRKIYISVLCLAVGGGAMGQDRQDANQVHDRNALRMDHSETLQFDRGSREVIWTNDFSNAADWESGSWPGAPNLQWQIGTNPASGEAAIDPIESTTAANGYAILDSDAFANQTEVESSHLTNTTPIDLTGYPNVVLEFETFYRKWTSEECYVVISTSNTDWPALTPLTDITEMNNVFHVFPGMQTQDPVENPTLIRLNISEIAGNQPQVWVRFHWTGTYGYAWYVDDVAIVEQPETDIVLDYGFISNVHLNNGLEYGRIPTSQMPSLFIGGGISNFGSAANTNVELLVNVTGPVPFDVMITEPELAAGVDTSMLDEVTPALTPGVYTANFTLSSTEEQDGSEFWENNTIDPRAFTITDDIYSLDNIGNHPAGLEDLTYSGSDVFNNNEDGAIFFTQYVIHAPLTVNGLEIQMPTGANASGSGGEIFIALYDSSDIIGDSYPEPVLGNPIAESNSILVSEAASSSGMMGVAFDEPVILQPGVYYAGVSLFGSGDDNHIHILDDETVPQPPWASLIYLPNDTDNDPPQPNRIWSNGNAFAIRLSMQPDVSVGESAELQGVTIYPNPTNGLVNVVMAEAGAYDVEVLNLLGERIYTTRIVNNGVLDLSGNAQGVYMVRVSNENASTVQRITLN